ncbi:hypothetical protein [Kitasatospora sp. NPDC093679]|uniref:hypothetical protein n=1 Tax=Kitasatospora sp. NPDC093679 TaxID=3154983 RepID=UPI00343B0143
MEAQRRAVPRSVWVVTGVFAAFWAVVLGGCTLLVQRDEARAEDRYTSTDWFDEVFPRLGPAVSGTWRSTDGPRDLLPSPDPGLAGFFRLPPGRIAELTAGRECAPLAAPDLTGDWQKELAGKGPEGASWIGCPSLDAELAPQAPAHASFWLDRASDTVYVLGIDL